DADQLAEQCLIAAEPAQCDREIDRPFGSIQSVMPPEGLGRRGPLGALSELPAPRRTTRVALRAMLAQAFSWFLQKSPTMLPLASMSIPSAPGTLGSPGIVRLSPAYATTKPAPAERATSRIVTVNPRGRPGRFGSSLREFCVLATHTGSRPYPSASNRASLAAAAGASAMPSAP